MATMEQQLKLLQNMKSSRKNDKPKIEHEGRPQEPYKGRAEGKKGRRAKVTLGGLTIVPAPLGMTASAPIVDKIARTWKDLFSNAEDKANKKPTKEDVKEAKEGLIQSVVAKLRSAKDFEKLGREPPKPKEIKTKMPKQEVSVPKTKEPGYKKQSAKDMAYKAPKVIKAKKAT